MGDGADDAFDAEMAHLMSGEYAGPTNIEEQHDMETYRCPGHPVERANSLTGEAFWGCSEFPTCRWTARA